MILRPRNIVYNVHCRTRASRLVARSMTSPFEQVSVETGFLPNPDPLLRLPQAEFVRWEATLSDIPKLSVVAGSGKLREVLLQLPPFEVDVLMAPGMAHDPAERGRFLWRAYSLLSFLSHAYMWCDGPDVPTRLPAVLAVPWCKVAAAVGMPPILTYSTYNLLNWRRLDPNGPIELGNIVCLNNFLGGVDEEWFRLVHVAIEAQAAPAIAALQPALWAAQQGDADGVLAGLGAITEALRRMQATFSRMGEKCDPAVYYKRVRQPMSGWRSNPDLPQGLIYEGVSEVPVQLYGETGAQSSIVAALDAALGIKHQQDSWLKEYLDTMRQHMPPHHRAFIVALEGCQPSLRVFAEQCSQPGVRVAYNSAVSELTRFRSQHRGYASAYIAQQSRRDAEERGTGGTDFMPALTGYRDATQRQLLPEL